MGYYFPKAKTTSDLTSKQNERYKVLRSREVELPSSLKDRFETIGKRIGPVTSGEIWSAFEELWQDAVVCWIISGENSEIEWSDLELVKDERTEEELQRDREAWQNTLREWKDRDKRERQECNEWERKKYPVRCFLRKLFSSIKAMKK